MTESNAENADLSGLRIDRSQRRKPPGYWKRWLHLLWILIPLLGWYGYQYGKASIAPAVKVRTTQVRVVTGSEAAADLVATGYVVAQVKAAVASKATGRLRVLNVEEGDRVKQGDILAELDNEDIRAQLDLARANLKIAEADTLAAGLNYRRQTRLLKTGGATDQIMENATAAYQRALANVEAMVAGVRAAEVALDNTIIAAPFDGTVLTKHADVGEMVAPFASASSSRGAVVTMADMRTLEVEADVSESNIQKVVVGAPCEIILDAYSHFKYPGFVKKIVPTADRARATVLTKIAFDSTDDRVLPEMSARVNFLPAEEGTDSAPESILAVDRDAITTRDETSGVFVVTGETVVFAPITTGRRLGEDTEVIRGVTAGQEVVLSPAGGLQAGDKIEK